jgi:hypothetical protein
MKPPHSRKLAPYDADAHISLGAFFNTRRQLPQIIIAHRTTGRYVLITAQEADVPAHALESYPWTWTAPNLVRFAHDHPCPFLAGIYASTSNASQAGRPRPQVPLPQPLAQGPRLSSSMFSGTQLAPSPVWLRECENAAQLYL